MGLKTTCCFHPVNLIVRIVDLPRKIAEEMITSHQPHNHVEKILNSSKMIKIIGLSTYFS